MTIEDIKITIKNHILNSISHRDLAILCNIFEIPTTGRRLQIQKRLVDSILIATNVDLLHRILYMINRPNRDSNGANQTISSQTRDVVQGFIQNDIINSTEMDRNNSYQSNGYVQRNTGPSINSKLYCISEEVLDSCPIDLRPEIIHGIDPMNIFVPNYTKYPCGNFNAPSTSPTVINGRVNTPNVQLPYCVKNTVISSSQFYCCQVVLHPLCLLIPKPTPNMCQPSRVMSKMQLTFSLSNSARHLITAHRTQLNNKRTYKWQVLIRFGIYDPSKPFPHSTSDDSVSNLPEYIPPYLTLYVNNVNVPLWDILPSNSTAKEGKRHPRPINISDYLKFSSTVDEQSYRQTINVNWWQTPGVYQYYYFAVYLERKLSVSELYNRFVSKTHHVQIPIDFTINFIRDKFSTNNNQYQKKNSDEIDDEDDLVISSVLPISLLCPVGKSRISCPLRGIHCQHLQCFDAHLYMMMNERRSVWKCPVCDSQATLNELFVDEFFLKIINDFSHDETITEVNVNPDGTYVAVAAKESREHKQHIGNIISNIPESGKKTNDHKSDSDSDESSAENQPVICLESDEEDVKTELLTQVSVANSTPSNAISSSTISSNGSTDAVATQKTATTGKGMTIDLTSDSEEERENALRVCNSRSVTMSSVTKPVSSVSQSHSHSRMPMPAPPPFQAHRTPISQNSYNMFMPPHQNIAPKLSHSNNFNKLTDSSGRATGTLSYHPHSQTTLVVPSSCPTVSIAPSSDPLSLGVPSPFHQISSQSSLGKVPSFLWMTSSASSTSHQRFPGGQSRTSELLNSYLPQLKPCFPALPGFGAPPGTGLVRTGSSTTPFPLSHPSTTAGLGAALLPRPPHPYPNQTTNAIRPKDPRGIPGKININANVHQEQVPSSSSLGLGNSHRQSAPTPEKKQKVEISRVASTAAPPLNVNARRSSRLLNQHRKIYRERSASVEEEEASSSSSSSDSSLGASAILSRGSRVATSVSTGSVVNSNQTSTDRRRKRKSALADSSESSVSSSLSPTNCAPINRKRKRLVADGGSDEERNCNRQSAESSTGSVLRDLRAQPLLILHKLDPVVLKLYSRQTDENNHQLVSGPGGSVVVPVATDSLETTLQEGGCLGDDEIVDSGGTVEGGVNSDGDIRDVDSQSARRTGSAPEDHDQKPGENRQGCSELATRFTTQSRENQSDSAGVGKTPKRKDSTTKGCHSNGDLGVPGNLK